LTTATASAIVRGADWTIRIPEKEFAMFQLGRVVLLFVIGAIFWLRPVSAPAQSCTSCSTYPDCACTGNPPTCTCGYSACIDVTHPAPCHYDRWPWGADGRATIYYRFAPGVWTSAEQNQITYAMRDWESVSSNIIRFEPRDVGDPALVINKGGSCNGYSACIANQADCYCNLSVGGAYHELGHGIGLLHHYQRYDRKHYIRTSAVRHVDANNLVCTGTGAAWCANGNETRCAVPDSLDYGPFDYRSTMNYRVTHPDIARWDGSPFTQGTTCNQIINYTPPAQCNDDLCTVCTPGPGVVCPQCTSCSKSQPQGLPTKIDGSAVVEHYMEPLGWRRFKRTVAEPAGATPYDYRLGGFQSLTSIAETSSPALESWENGTLFAYVRGSDNHIYRKSKNANGSWTSWQDCGTPAGSGTTSDPAVVSWGSDRTDLVARRFTTVSIKSFNAGSCAGTFQSLGTVPSPPASAPAITSWGANRLDVFVRGTDNKLYWKNCTANCSGANGTWSAWQPVGDGTFQGKPAAVSRGSDSIDVFVHGMDNELWAINYASGWGGWYKVATTGTLKWDGNCTSAADACSPAATARSNSAMDVFVRGQDDKLFVTTWDGGATWTGYGSIGGVVSSSPAAVAHLRATNRRDVAATMGETATASYGTAYGVWWKEWY